MKLEGKVAIVTGGSRGIGRAIALAFAQEGANVAVNYLTHSEAAEGAVSKILDMGREAIAIKADVSRSGEVAKMLEKVLNKFDEVNILVNNAGTICQQKVVDLKEQDWDRVLRVNLKSCFLCCKVVAKQMIEQNKGGKIINISSIHARLSEPSASAYTASKGGMEAFSRTLATEVAPYKINVNVIEPGATYTDLTIPMYTESVKKALHMRIPLKEIARPEYIAGGAVFLASDDARYVTGQVLIMDGGYVMDGSLPGAAYWAK